MVIKNWLKKRRLDRIRNELRTNPEALELAARAVIDHRRSLPADVCEQVKRAYQVFFLTEGRWVK